MLIGKFITQVNTTRNTVRFYIEKKLLNPEKMNGKYHFNEKDIDDFYSIQELKNLGFSINMICDLNTIRITYGCGTKQHLDYSKVLITHEIEKTKQEIVKLKQRLDIYHNYLEILTRNKN